MEIDLSLTIVSVIALCAIISPILVSIINNIFNLKIKKLEFKHQEFIKIFKEFTLKYDALHTSVDYSRASKFQMAAMQMAVICKDHNTRNNLIKLGNIVMKNKCRNTETDKLFELCVKQLFHEV